MSKSIKSDWLVLDSIENDSQESCIDFFQRTDGTFGFEAFRRAAEDQGEWQPLSHYSILVFQDLPACLAEAVSRFDWLNRHFVHHSDQENYINTILNKLH